MSIQLDDTDRQILEILQNDSSITNVALADKVGLAPATTLERVRKLERSGVIRHYGALVDADKIDMGLKSSHHGQMAMTIDATGCLTSWNAKMTLQSP